MLSILCDSSVKKVADLETAWLLTLVCPHFELKKLIFLYLPDKISLNRADTCAAMLKIALHLDKYMI